MSRQKKGALTERQAEAADVIPEDRLDGDGIGGSAHDVRSWVIDNRIPRRDGEFICGLKDGGLWPTGAARKVQRNNSSEDDE
jgi:hypothetical protein